MKISEVLNEQEFSEEVMTRAKRIAAATVPDLELVQTAQADPQGADACRVVAITMAGQAALYIALSKNAQSLAKAGLISQDTADGISQLSMQLSAYTSKEMMARHGGEEPSNAREKAKAVPITDGSNVFKFPGNTTKH